MAGPTQTDEEQVQRLKQRLERRLELFRALAMVRPPQELDKFARPLLDLLKEPRLGREIAHTTREAVKAIELEANIRACDAALRQALECAKADQKVERQAAVVAARAYLRRADVLGAGEDFKRAAEMTMEAALLTGGVKQVGPTRAKPLDLTPRPPNRAKFFETEETATAA